MSIPHRRSLAFLCAIGLGVSMIHSLRGPLLRAGDFPGSWGLPDFASSGDEAATDVDGTGKPSQPWLPPRLSPFSPPTADLAQTPDAVSVPIQPPSLLSGPWPAQDEIAIALQRTHKASRESAGFWGSLSASTEVNDTRARTWDDPGWKRTWKTDDTWKYSLGNLSVFGQVGATGDEINQQTTQVTGRTGLACKVPMGVLGEYTLRSGPGISCTDPLHPLQTRQRSDWMLEIQARWPLLFGVGLELQSTALPALSPLDQNLINHDVGLAFPMGVGNKLKVGAKRQQTGLTDPRSWTDTTQLYMGLELNH